MRRRAFLSSSAAAGWALSARGASAATSEAGRYSEDGRFGKTGEKLTIIGQAGGRFPMCGFEEAKAITLRAYELGINYFDNARLYWDGRSEEVYGAVLAPFRKAHFSDHQVARAEPERRRTGPREIAPRPEDRLRGPLADSPGEHQEEVEPDLRAGRRDRGF